MTTNEKPTMHDSMQWALRQPRGLHVVATMLGGETRAHLVKAHPDAPRDGTTVDLLRAHFHAHRDIPAIPNEGD